MSAGEAEQDTHGHPTTKHDEAQGRGQSSSSGKARDRRGLADRASRGMQELTRQRRGRREGTPSRQQHGHRGPGGAGCV